MLPQTGERAVAFAGLLRFYAVAALGGGVMGNRTAFLRLMRRTVCADVPGFMRVSQYKVSYFWAPPPDKDGTHREPHWTDPVERIDVFRRDAIAAVLHLKKPEGDKLFLVKQFRLSTTIDAETGDPDSTRDGAFLELMAGVREPGEPPIETFIRETREESGFEIVENTVELISTFYPSPGACSERIFLYYARVHPNAAVEDAPGWGIRGENITRVPMAPGEFLQAAESGDIVDAKAIIAAGWLRQNYQDLFGAAAPPPPVRKVIA